MTIGSDQLDAWGQTLIECDNLYREIQLLVRINPEAYNVDSDALTITAIANADAWDNANLIHPIAFARYWAWHLAAENKAIPPITNNWVTLIRYVSAHLQYLGRDDREWFADELRQMRGLLGALVNENGLAQGEAEALSALRGRDARAKLRAWARTTNYHMSRKDLATIFPELDKLDWQALRMRKVRSDEEIPTRMYPADWVAARGSAFDTTPVPGYAEEYSDVYADRENRIISWDDLDESLFQYDRHTRMGTLDRPRRRQTAERGDV